MVNIKKMKLVKSEIMDGEPLKLYNCEGNVVMFVDGSFHKELIIETDAFTKEDARTLLSYFGFDFDRKISARFEDEDQKNLRIFSQMIF